MRVGFTAVVPLLLVGSGVATAQDRSGDNAVTQAEDAFGFSVGRESIGIYGPGNARGFSPNAAGNNRIDGLYFDPAAQTGLPSAIVASTSVKVGLSAQGYPFAAPSGIVDNSLRRPDDRLGASLLLSGDAWGGWGGELNLSVPVNATLAIGGGATWGHTEYADGTDNVYHSEAVIARWRPTSAIEIVPFWTLHNAYNDESGPGYIPATASLPPLPRPRTFVGPGWADYRYSAGNHGVLASYAPARDWVVRVGAFRSLTDQITSYTNLLLDVMPDGSAHRLVIADPRSKSVSLSGEARVTHSIAEGPRLHVIHLSARVRDARREYGGSDEIDFGPTNINAPVTYPRPDFRFGPTSEDRVRQTTLGIAYDGRWKNVGEVSVSIARAEYRKDTERPGLPRVTGRAQPLLWNVTAAVELGAGITAYAGYAKGLEESGVAPGNAANRNQPLPAILTDQKDAGIRFGLAGMKAVVGVFDLRRPYFSFDAANAFTQVGDVRSRGAEFSLSGNLTPRLTMLLGGVFLDPKVEKDVAITRAVGARPTGLPDDIVSLNLNWRTPFVDGLSLDGGVSHRGKAAATVDNSIYLDPRAIVSLGGRYGFKLYGKSATFRLQGTNILDRRAFGLNGPGIFVTNNGRGVSGYLTVDI